MSKQAKINSQTKSAYLDLLRSSLWGTPINSELSPLEDISKLAARQTTRGLIYQALMDQHIPLEKETYLKYKKFLLKVTGNHISNEKTISITIDALRSAGIEPILLKGEGNAYYYPLPYIRECGDVDLYVGKKNYQK